MRLCRLHIRPQLGRGDKGSVGASPSLSKKQSLHTWDFCMAWTRNRIELKVRVRPE